MTSGPVPTIRTVPSTTALSAEERGWCWPPSRCSPRSRPSDPPRPLLLLGPGGRRFDQAWAAELAGAPGFSLLCGRYEGVDQRVADHLVDGELSLGDFVLAGGEVAAIAVIEAVARLVPGVMGNDDSAIDESFGAGCSSIRSTPGRPLFRGWAVPEVLRSGDHARVARWRQAQSLARTRSRRPDLIAARGRPNALRNGPCSPSSDSTHYRRTPLPRLAGAPAP